MTWVCWARGYCRLGLVYLAKLPRYFLLPVRNPLRLRWGTAAVCCDVLWRSCTWSTLQLASATGQYVVMQIHLKKCGKEQSNPRIATKWKDSLVPVIISSWFLECIRCSGRMMCPCSPHEWSLKPLVFKTCNYSCQNDANATCFILYSWARRKQSLSKLLPKPLQGCP